MVPIRRRLYPFVFFPEDVVDVGSLALRRNDDTEVFRFSEVARTFSANLNLSIMVLLARLLRGLAASV